MRRSRKPPFNDWGTPTPVKKLATFQERLQRLADMIFGVDQDGDSAVEVMVTDRTRYEHSYFSLVPYDHHAKTEEEREVVAEAVEMNLETAISQWKTLRNIRRFQRARARDQAARAKASPSSRSSS